MRVPSKVANDELVDERRAQLVSAATSLFLKQGFHKTSVREIAAATGWQPGTLYLYISRKEDVLYLIIESISQELSKGFWALPTLETASATLRQAVEYLFRGVNRLRREVKLMYRESASLPPEYLELIKSRGLENRKLLVGIIERGIREGEFRPADAELTAHNIVMMAHMWALKGWAIYPKMSFEKYLRGQMEILFFTLTGETDPQEQRRETALSGTGGE